MSDTVSTVTALMPRSAAIVYRTADSISMPRLPRSRPPPGPIRVRVVEDVARHDGTDVDRLAPLESQAYRQRDELPVGDGSVGLAACVAQSGAIRGVAASATTRSAIDMFGCNAPHVPTRMMRDAPSLISSSYTMAALGQPIPLA